MKKSISSTAIALAKAGFHIVLAVLPFFGFAQKGYVGMVGGFDKMSFGDRQFGATEVEKLNEGGSRAGVVAGWRLGKFIFTEVGFVKNWERYDQNEHFWQDVYDPTTGIPTGQRQLVEYESDYRGSSVEFPVSVGAGFGQRSLRVFGQVGLVASTASLNEFFETPRGRTGGPIFIKPGPGSAIDPGFCDCFFAQETPDRLGGFAKIGLEKQLFKNWIVRSSWSVARKKATANSWSQYRKTGSSGFETSVLRLF